MSVPSSALPLPHAPALDSPLTAVYELTKPRITRLVAITSGVGFTLAAVSPHHTWTAPDLITRAVLCIAGTILSSSGANALNQWWERDRDALMPRTCARPLPQARLAPRTALLWGLLLSGLGVGLLALLGPAPALVSLVTILIYVLVYTPLKPVTTLNTLIGAVPGALPPLIGWSALTPVRAASSWSLAGLDSLAHPGGWSLVTLMIIWQVPHFLAIAWIYRDDYAKGGYRMLPLLDPTGRTTSRTILVWSIVLIPAAAAPWLLLPDRISPVYALIALALGVAFGLTCLRFVRSRQRTDARRVFIASIIHLPILLIALVADSLVGLWLRH